MSSQQEPQTRLQHHQTALDIVDKKRLAQFERVRASTEVGIDLVHLGCADEGRVPWKSGQHSRRLGLIGSLAAGLFYLGWLHAVSGRGAGAVTALSKA